MRQERLGACCRMLILIRFYLFFEKIRKGRRNTFGQIDWRIQRTTWPRRTNFILDAMAQTMTKVGVDTNDEVNAIGAMVFHKQVRRV